MTCSIEQINELVEGARKDLENKGKDPAYIAIWTAHYREFLTNSDNYYQATAEARGLERGLNPEEETKFQSLKSKLENAAAKRGGFESVEQVLGKQESNEFRVLLARRRAAHQRASKVKLPGPRAALMEKLEQEAERNDRLGNKATASQLRRTIKKLENLSEQNTRTGKKHSTIRRLKEKL